MSLDELRIQAALEATKDIVPWQTNRRRYVEEALAAADRVSPMITLMAVINYIETLNDMYHWNEWVCERLQERFWP